MSTEIEAKIRTILSDLIDAAVVRVTEANDRTASLVAKALERIERLEDDNLPALPQDIGTPTLTRKGPPPGVPFITKVHEYPGPFGKVADPTTDMIVKLTAERDEQRRKIRALEHQLQSTEYARSVASEALTMVKAKLEEAKGQEAKDDETMIALRRLALYPHNALPLAEAIAKTFEHLRNDRDQVVRERDKLIEDGGYRTAEEATDNITGQLAAVCAERNKTIDDLDVALKSGEVLQRRVEDIQCRLEHATKRAQLADLEWNNAREKINPLIAKEFDGQTLADAVVHTIQILEARLKSAQEAGQRAHDDAKRIQMLLRSDAEQVNKLKLIRTGHLSTIADQAKHIHELREALATANSNHAAALHRQAATWESDRAAGQAQNQRLIEMGQEQRTAIANITADRERALGLLSSATSLIDDIARAIGLAPVASREKTIEAIQGAIVSMRAELHSLRTRAIAAESSATSHRMRVRDLEDLARRRDVLNNTVIEQAGSLRDRVQTIADEKFGPFPVLTADQALSAIEQGTFFQRLDAQAGAKLFDGLKEWLDNARGRDGAVDVLQSYEAECRRVQAMREEGMASYYGTREDGDCQQGTCDCPGPDGEPRSADPAKG